MALGRQDHGGRRRRRAAAVAPALLACVRPSTCSSCPSLRPRRGAAGFQLAHIARQRVLGKRCSAASLSCGAGMPDSCWIRSSSAWHSAGRSSRARAAAAGVIDHVQAVVQILAEAPGLHIGRQVAVRGADDAHVHRLFLRGAQRAHRALLDGAQQFGLCMASGRSPISSRNSVPPARPESNPRGRWRRRCEPFAAPKNSASSRFSEWRRSSPPPAGCLRAGCWRGWRVPPAPCRARFAMDQHRGHAARHFGNALLDAAHEWGLIRLSARQNRVVITFAGIGAAAGFCGCQHPCCPWMAGPRPRRNCLRSTGLVR